MKSLVFLFLFIGCALVIGGYVKTNQQCPPPVVEYRYVPMTFAQEQDLSVPVLSVYGKMFEDNSPWVKAQGYADQTTVRQLQKDVNKNLI